MEETPNIPKRVSIAQQVRAAKTADKKDRLDAAKKSPTSDGSQLTTPTLDSFVNFAQKMGVGADNPLSTSSYGFNPITRIQVMLEWIHRGSWLGGVAVDVVADDMTRAGIEMKGEMLPEDIESIEETAVTYGVWNSLNEAIKWARLYGGSLAVLMVDGQDTKTPLRLETIAKDQFQGLLVLDRWMVEPSLNNLVTVPGPDLGLPKFYKILADSPALPNLTIHHSRVIRLVGITLPWRQRMVENLWGISVLERLYDRMIAYDSATTGAAQLVYKAFLRTYKIKGMREVIASGGKALQGLTSYVQMMSRFQNIEGVTLMDGDDEFEHTEHGAFTGLSDTLTQFGQQLAGALQIPLVRLFGQSPSGFSSGESDLRMYYDSINQQQNQVLKVGVTKVYRAMAASLQIKLPEGFKIKFNTLWQLTETEKSEIAAKNTDSITSAEDSGLISKRIALKELKQQSSVTGIFTNITEKDISSADDVIPPPDATELVPPKADSEDPAATGKKVLPEEVKPKPRRKMNDHD